MTTPKHPDRTPAERLEYYRDKARESEQLAARRNGTGGMRRATGTRRRRWRGQLRH